MEKSEFTRAFIETLDMATEGRAAEAWTQASLATVRKVRAQRDAGDRIGTPWAPSADTRHRVRSYIRQYGL